MNNNGFTPTEQRIIQLLNDGLLHSREEIHTCLDDELSDISAIRPHITHIRNKLRPFGEDIMCRRHNGSYYYQQVRLVSSGHDGRT